MIQLKPAICVLKITVEFGSIKYKEIKNGKENGFHGLFNEIKQNVKCHMYETTF